MTIYSDIEKLYREDYKTFLKMAARKVDPLWQEDLVQETFERALRYSPTYNPQLSELRTWVSRIFDSVVKKYRNHLMTEELTEDSWLTNEGPDNTLSAVVEDFLKDIKDRKENQQQVLYCYFILGMKPKEVTQVVPESIHNVNWIVQEFRRDMRGRYAN